MRIRAYVQRLLLIALMGTLFGCATPQHYGDAIRSWNGVPVQFLMKQWGKPTKINVLANGHQFYLYEAVEARSFTGAYAPPSYTRASLQEHDIAVLEGSSSTPRHYGVTFWCDTGFEINKNGIIVNTVTRGNNCVSTEAGETRMIMSDN